ncbi:phage tail assembly chaperone [Janthinobacterium fluminis]
MYRAAAEQAAPPLPYELAHIWEWFVQLNRKRQNGMALNPLSSAEILAWQRRHRLDIEPFEHAALDRLDALYLSHQSVKE